MCAAKAPCSPLNAGERRNVNERRSLVSQPITARGELQAGSRGRAVGTLSRCPCHQGSLGLWIRSRKGSGREHRGSALYYTPKLSVLDLPAPFPFLTMLGRAQLGGSGRSLPGCLQAVDSRPSCAQASPHTHTNTSFALPPTRTA